LNKGEHGRKLLYTVLYTAQGGGVLVEKGIVTRQIRYKFSLHALQSTIRNIAPPNGRAFGIQSNVLNEAMHNKFLAPLLKVKKRSSCHFSYSNDTYDGNDNLVSNSDNDGIQQKCGRLK
jgi:hypothetical protein